MLFAFGPIKSKDIAIAKHKTLIGACTRPNIQLVRKESLCVVDCLRLILAFNPSECRVKRNFVEQP